MNLLGWIGLLLTLFSMFATVVMYVSYTRYKSESVDQEEQKLRLDLKDAVTELKTVSTTVKVFMAEQALSGKFTADALAAITRKMDNYEVTIQELVRQQDWLSTVLKAKGITD